MSEPIGMWEHLFYSLLVLVPMWYIAHYLGKEEGKKEGVEDAIEFFMVNGWFTEPKAQELKNEQG